MTEPNLYAVGYDVGFEDGFKEAQAQNKKLLADLALADLAIQKIENISERFVNSDKQSEALKEIQDFCIQVLKELKGDSNG